MVSYGWLAGYLCILDDDDDDRVELTAAMMQEARVVEIDVENRSDRKEGKEGKSKEKDGRKEGNLVK